MGGAGAFVSFAAPMFFRAVLLAARWAGCRRKRMLEELPRMGESEKEREILVLRNKVGRLEALAGLLQKQLGKGPHRPRYTLEERLCILWHLEYLQVPRRRVREYFGIARSTPCRWLHGETEAEGAPLPPSNRTPGELAALVWEIARANPAWGRFRIASQLALLKVFLSASAVRNVLLRPRPGHPKAPLVPAAEISQLEPVPSRSIPAWYPNHVWSVDLTEVFRWGIWPTSVIMAIDHFSRKIVAVKPLEGPNAGWVIEAMEDAFRQFGSPKHIITDQGSVFTGEVLQELLARFEVKHRLGAVGKHGSIAVTERAIETLK